VKLYKLVDKDGHVYNVSRWCDKRPTYGEGDTIEANDMGNTPRLCTDTVVHAYTNLSQAFLCDVLHCSRWGNRRGFLYEAEGEVVTESDNKVGCRTLKLGRRIKFKRIKAWDLCALLDALGLCTDYVIDRRTNKMDRDAMYTMRYDLADYHEYTDQGSITWDDLDWLLGLEDK
jgi:hypothetical protein